MNIMMILITLNGKMELTRKEHQWLLRALEWKRTYLPYKTNPSISHLCRDVYEAEWMDPFLEKVLAYEPPGEKMTEIYEG